MAGVLALLTGGTVSVKEIVTSGSLWLTLGGALLAFIGGFWTLWTARTRYRIELVKLKQAEFDFERSQLGNGAPTFPKRNHPHSPHRR